MKLTSSPATSWKRLLSLLPTLPRHWWTNSHLDTERRVSCRVWADGYAGATCQWPLCHQPTPDHTSVLPSRVRQGATLCSKSTYFFEMSINPIVPPASQWMKQLTSSGWASGGRRICSVVTAQASVLTLLSKHEMAVRAERSLMQKREAHSVSYVLKVVVLPLPSRFYVPRFLILCP